VSCAKPAEVGGRTAENGVVSRFIRPPGIDFPGCFATSLALVLFWLVSGSLPKSLFFRAGGMGRPAGRARSGELHAPDPLEGPKEDRDVMIVAEDPADEAASRADDLAGKPDEALEKALELHAHRAAALAGVGDEHRVPRLQAPSQRRDHHVGPVGNEIADRHAKGANNAVVLRDQVFLVAAVVAFENDLLARSSPGRATIL